MIQENILWFKVPMHYSDPMDVFDARYDLLIILACLFFLQALRFSNLLEKLIPRTIFHN
jgi:hypothetical protein